MFSVLALVYSMFVTLVFICVIDYAAVSVHNHYIRVEDFLRKIREYYNKTKEQKDLIKIKTIVLKRHSSEGVLLLIFFILLAPTIIVYEIPFWASFFVILGMLILALLLWCIPKENREILQTTKEAVKAVRVLKEELLCSSEM